MNKTPILHSLLVAVFSTLFIFSGCATVKKQPAPTVDPVAIKMIDIIKKQNSDLNTFNGQGTITITDPSKVSSYRLAWAGEAPDKIRLIILFSGTPVETVATDGEYLYLKSHRGSHSPIKRKKKNPSLEPYISLPLTTDQIVHYLSGRIPVPDYEKAIFEKKQDGSGSVLTFFKRPETIVQQVFFDENDRVLSYEIIVNEKLSYNIALVTSETDDRYIFPATLKVTQKERSCIIMVEKTMANPELYPATFVIIP